MSRSPLIMAHRRAVGRSRSGRITTRHRSTGGVRRAYRLIDWRRTGERQAKVLEVQYDPNRTARVALVQYDKGDTAYFLASDKMRPGYILHQGEKGKLTEGNFMPLRQIPTGIGVYNVELRPGQGAKLARAAGATAVVGGTDGQNVQLKLASGRQIWVNGQCRAAIGQAGNSQHSTRIIGKAGRSRRLGKRPTVRGKAMHPAAHPHGGGEGGNPIGLKKGPKTKWGAQALGVKTRRRQIKLVKVK